MEIEPLYVYILCGLSITYLCLGCLRREMILIVSYGFKDAVKASRVMSSVAWAEVGVNHSQIMNSVAGIVSPCLCMIVYWANM